MQGQFVLAVHGGAGTLAPEIMTDAIEQVLHSGLRAALKAGHQVLAAGGPAIDAVVTAVAVLEDDPLFNAGYGAVVQCRRGGRRWMRPSWMAAPAPPAPSPACADRANPVLAARAVMDHSPHVLLVGRGCA